MKKILIVVLIFLSAFPTPILAQEIATESAEITTTPTNTPAPEISPIPSPTLEPSPAITSEIISQVQESSEDDTNQSATIKEKTVFKKLRKNHFQIDESVVTNIENTYGEDIEVTVLDAKDQPVVLPILKEEVSDSTKITLLPSYKMQPGKFKLKIVDSEGAVQNQEFTWGVLALNPDKSIYLPNETAKIAMAVLDEFGAMVCTAKINLTITSPDGSKTELTTEKNQIIINPECNIRDFTTQPDYETSYKVSQTGTYSLSLSATTPKGTYTISDSFQVQESIPFDIQRQGPTRIFPLKTYPVDLNIKFNQDFTGKIVETVPAEFDISAPSNSQTYKEIITETLDTPATPTISISSPFVSDYPITQGFGEKVTDPELTSLYQNFGLAGHDGIDYSMPINTPVLASDDGKVVQAGKGAYGTTIVIEHTWGKTYYGHLNETQVHVDQVVNKGDQIGLSGNSGISTGPHLHFGVKQNTTSFFNGYYGKSDPLPLLTGHLLSTQSVKRIIWEVSVKSGTTLNLGYRFDAPEVTPELYLTGPLKFYSTNQEIPDTQIDTSSENPFVLGLATQAQDPILVFQENRQWQIAADADIVIDSNVFANNGPAFKNKHRMVFTTDQIGYVAYVDSDQTCVYSKTTDGGATWGSAVALFATGGVTSCMLWYDRWTPGDVTGNYIYFLESDGNSDVEFERVDTANSDAQAGETIIQATSTNLGALDGQSITKGTDGILYVSVSDNSSGNDILSCSATCTTGSNWTSMADNLDPAQDYVMLQPLLNGKILALRLDISQGDLDYDILTGTTWAGFVDIDTNAPNGTNPDVFNIAATTRLDTGYVYVSYVANQGTDDTSEVRTQVFDGTTWTQKTDALADTEPATTEMAIFSDIAVDTESGKIYVAYTYGNTSATQNVYYKTSIDDMSTWSSQTQLNTSHATDDIKQIQLTPISGERIYFSYWYNSTTDTLEGGTVEDLAPPAVEEVMRHGMWFSKAGTEMQFSF